MTVLLGMNVSCTCIVRVLCLIKLDWMEEKVGEIWIRIIVASFSFICGTAVSIAQLVAGDILTGPIYSLIAKDVVKAGKTGKKCHNRITTAVRYILKVDSK